MDKKKNKYKGVISPPIKDEFLRGYNLGKARLPKPLKKQPMGPPRPKKRLLHKMTYEDKPVMQTEAIMSKSTASVKASKPRYGAGGTDNPKVQKKKPATKKVAKKKPKTEAQRIYEKQIKARKRRQKKDPLGRD